MKKKLIAARTSAAMVATMVPATAFAADTAVMTANAGKKPAATASAAAEVSAATWADAWEKIKDLNPSTMTYDPLYDEAIEEAAGLYSTASSTTSKEDKDLFKKIVEKEWELRIAEATKLQNKVSGEITKENVSEAAAFCAKTGSWVKYLTEKGDLYKVLDGLSLSYVKTLVQNAKKDANALSTKLKSVVPVVEAIEKIKEVTKDNYGDKDNDQAIADASTLYDGLANNAELTQKVENSSKLSVAVSNNKKFKEEVDRVDELITAIPNSLTADNADAYRTAYERAEKAYKELGDGQKAKVTNASALTVAKNTLDKYDANSKLGQTAKELIQALPASTSITESNTLQVAQAKAAFDAYQKVEPNTPLLSGAESGKLTDVVKAINDVLAPKGTVNADKVSTAVKSVADMIAALPDSVTLADAQKVKEAKSAYDAITTAFDGAVNTAITTALKGSLSKLEKAAGTIDSLTKDDTAVVAAFIDLVRKIDLSNKLNGIDEEDDVVNEAYILNTRAASDAYGAFTDNQLAIVEADSVTYAKLAVEKLEIAKKNVAAFETRLTVRELINTLPDADKLDLANAADVQKVKNAQAAYEALTNAVKKQLKTGDYFETGKLENYKKAVEKVADYEAKDAAAAVVTAINNLPKLADKFASKADIDAAKASMEQAQAAYNKLTDAQKGQVTNYQALEKYAADFDKLVKAYTNALYTEAEKIDTANLTAADAAKIAELTALLNGEYGVATGDITGFNANTYEALKDALATFQATVGNLANATIEVADQSYTGEALTPAVTVKNSKGEVVNADEYMVFYENNTEVGTATVTVIAKTGGLYTGAKTGTFKINGISLADAAITVANQSYTGSALTPAVTVKVGTTTLKANTDYTVSYSNNTAIGTATVTITGIGKYSGTATKTFTISKVNLKSVASVTGVVSRYYTGKNRTQTDLKVYVAGKALNKANYSVAYKNNKNVGKATLTITGKGNYTGTITKTFVIKPRKVANVKVTKGKKRVTVRYKKQNGARYQIYYKTAGSKAKTVKTTAVKRTIKNLKGGKRYTIKVRAYKKIGSKTYYGKYSAAKKVTVKR